MNQDQAITPIYQIAIIVNFLLVLFKAFIGYTSGSVAIMLDAVSNFSDILILLVALIGTVIAKRFSQKNQRRFEQIECGNSIVVGVIIMIAGMISFLEAVHKIWNPTPILYTKLHIILVISAVLVRFLLAFFLKWEGIIFESCSLTAIGKDTFLDSVLSTATLCAAILSYGYRIHIEGYLSAIISVMIIKLGSQVCLEHIKKLEMYLP